MLLLLLLPLTLAVQGTKVFEFSTAWRSQAILLSPLSDLGKYKAVSVCYRVNIDRFSPNGRQVTALDYSDPASPLTPELTSYWSDEIGPNWLIHNNMLLSEETTKPVLIRRWYHICLTLDLDTGKQKMIVDGNVVTLWAVEVGLHSLLGNLSFSLGAMVTSDCTAATPKNCNSQFAGRIADLNIFGRVVDEKEILHCRDTLRGDILDWTQAKWAMHEVKVTEEDNVCHDTDISLMLFNEARSFSESQSFCQSFGAKMVAPKTNMDKDRLTAALQRSRCFSAYVSWTDKYKEGVFLDSNMEEVENVSMSAEMVAAWGKGEPNGGAQENCVEYRNTGDGRYLNDLPCSSRICTACNYTSSSPILLTLKVKHDDVTFTDRKFVFTEEDRINAKPVYLGYHGWNAHWNNSAWTMSDGKDKVVAVMEDNKYPVGRNRWLVRDAAAVWLTLTVCNNSNNNNQFSCDDGNCVDLMKRCDDVVDCGDGSDESSCSLLSSLSPSYRKISPPPHIPTITLDFTIHSFSQIDFSSMTLTVDFSLGLNWADERLQFMHLQPSPALNVLSDDLMSSIWNPEIVFVNTAGNVNSAVDAEAENYVLRHQMNPTVVTDSLSMEAFAYLGKLNPLLSHRKYTVAFGCEFELAWYPFDLQRCRMSFKLKRAVRTEAKLKVGTLLYMGKEDLLEYRVMETSAAEEYGCGRENTSTCVDVVVLLKRRIGNHVVITFLPTMCLLLTIYFTHFYLVEHYEVRLMVALTGMLVISSLFTTTSASLPNTSYLKMVDVWMLFCFLLPFGEVVLHTIVEYLEVGSNNSNNNNNNNREKQRMIDMFSRVFVAAVLIVFNVGFWSVAASHEGGILL